MCDNSFLDRSFMYATPTLWNALDLDNKDTPQSEVLCKLSLIICILFFKIFLFLPCVSTVTIVYIIISPLNSYLYIHWILDFK